MCASVGNGRQLYLLLEDKLRCTSLLPWRGTPAAAGAIAPVAHRRQFVVLGQFVDEVVEVKKPVEPGPDR